MKYITIKKTSFALGIILLAASCAKKLDIFPQNDRTSQQVYSTAAGYKSVLAKVYSTLSISGNNGPAGSPDIAGGLDEGSQVGFIRAFFNAQELPTDEAIVCWDDQTIKNFHHLSWNSNDPFLLGMYARPIYNITLINEYLRESTDEKLASRGISGAEADDIRNSRAEVRFLRAFNYWVMMDLFGRSTFITEADGVGTFLPVEKLRPELYAYIESELLDIEDDLSAPRTAEYGRADQAAVWALLARIYLNASTYISTPKNGEAITYAGKVIAAGYSLHPRYDQLFMADNEKRTNEIIFAANCDGLRTQSFGNTSFFIHAASGSNDASVSDHPDFGANGGWGGYRATSALGSKFPADGTGKLDSTQDKRAAHFYTSAFIPTPAQMAIPSNDKFSYGLHVRKYVNKRSDGGAVHDATMAYSDVDFPIFRLSEMYLIYAEATVRGGAGGNAGTALGYVNLIRARASATAFTGAELTLNNLLDERARELFWEGHRRTDLVRYNLLTTGDYVWPWKGGVPAGQSVESKYNIYPIPSNNRTANSNLSQNEGYN